MNPNREEILSGLATAPSGEKRTLPLGERNKYPAPTPEQVSQFKSWIASQTPQ